MRANALYPKLVTGSLVVAMLCTLLVRGGWLSWLPVLLALAIVYGVTHSTRH